MLQSHLSSSFLSTSEYTDQYITDLKIPAGEIYIFYKRVANQFSSALISINIPGQYIANVPAGTFPTEVN
jgi:hypothetical protein